MSNFNDSMTAGPDVAFNDGTYGAATSAEGRTSPLEDLMGNVDISQNQTRDGQPQKRRGPKPDSKPAQNRRQELNRQAQRTHRERKEKYTKDLEAKVMSFRDQLKKAGTEQHAMATEIQHLRQLLDTHGIPYGIATPNTVYNSATTSSAAGSNYLPSNYQSSAHQGSVSGSVSSGYYQDGNGMAATMSSPNTLLSSPRTYVANSPQAFSPAAMQNQNAYSQLAVDFVLGLESYCSAHTHYLHTRAHNPSAQPFHHPLEPADDASHPHASGHALMASAPGLAAIRASGPENPPNAIHPGHAHPDNVPPPDLTALFEASARLPRPEGEITPVQAWVLARPEERGLSEGQLGRLRGQLQGKVRCYGFGACLEAYEVRDALDAVVTGVKTEPMDV